MSSPTKINKTPSIHSRLLFGLVIPLIIIATLFSVEIYLSSKKIAIGLFDQTLLSVMLVVSENVITTSGDLISENILEALNENLGDQFFYHVSGPDKAFVTGYHGVPLAANEADLHNPTPFFYDSTYQGDRVRVVRMSQLISENDLNGWMNITAWQKTGQIDNLTFELFKNSILRLLFMIVCAGVIVWIAVTVGLRPLERLSRSIKRRSADDLSPIKSTVPVEVKELVVSMNSLFSQLTKSNEARERFLGDAAHQLRNPIAALKAQSEAALENQSIEQYRSSIEKIHYTSQLTGKLIEQMLISAKAHAQNPQATEQFDLVELMNEAAHQQAYGAMDKDQEYTLNIEIKSLMIRGYRGLLKEAVLNLIDNAISHNKKGSQIEIGLLVENKLACLIIKDNGLAINEKEFNQLLEPFRTGSSESPGSGLGLSVVNDIAKMHGGDLSLKHDDQGIGKSLQITLPIVQD